MKPTLATMKINRKEEERQVSMAMKENGAFFAFGDKQFNEKKDPNKTKVDYCNIFGGMVCPKANKNKMLNALRTIYPK